jgi:hypothetical protein
MLLRVVPNSTARFRIWVVGASQRWIVEPYKFAACLWSVPVSKRLRIRAKRGPMYWIQSQLYWAGGVGPPRCCSRH